MFDEDAVAAVVVLWVAFMAVLGFYVIRIGMMLHQQRSTERYYRLRLALHRGHLSREAARVESSERAGA
jgi:hypothetical protein